MNTIGQSKTLAEPADKAANTIQFIPMDKVPYTQVLEWKGVKGFGASKAVK